MVVECAFGSLKGRFHSLTTRLDPSKCNIPIVETACCVRHNICESKGEMYLSGWNAEAQCLAKDLEQRHQGNKESTSKGTAYQRGFERVWWMDSFESHACSSQWGLPPLCSSLWPPNPFNTSNKKTYSEIMHFYLENTAKTEKESRAGAWLGEEKGG